jgi:predicted Zn-dependent protease
MSYFINYGGNIYHMIGVSTLQDFNAYANIFSNTMQNFKQLTDQAKINKKPERVRLRTVNQTTTLENALRSYGVPQARLNEISILNGIRLNENVTSGMMIKIIAE